MKLFAELESAEHSTVVFLEKVITEIEGKAPAIEHTIDVSLTYVGPLLVAGLDAIGDPAVAALVAPIITKARTDLTVASALVTDLGPTPTASSAFADVATNLSGILTLAGVKNATTVAAVTKAVSEVGTLAVGVGVAASAIKAAAATPPAPAPAP